MDPQSNFIPIPSFQALITHMLIRNGFQMIPPHLVYRGESQTGHIQIQNISETIVIHVTFADEDKPFSIFISPVGPIWHLEGMTFTVNYAPDTVQDAANCIETQIVPKMQTAGFPFFTIKSSRVRYLRIPRKEKQSMYKFWRFYLGF